MKFGNNLQHLSIPEWKSYNIDYNDLKYRIKQITKQDSRDLDELRSAFIENFEFINLFIATKHGELTRKFKNLEYVFNRLRDDEDENGNASGNDACCDDMNCFLIEIDELFFQAIELSIALKDLSKFILIQKIALKKIFKKFLKYYKHKKQGCKFVSELKNLLFQDSKAFINFDLTKLTLQLTNFINLVKYERNMLESFYTNTLHRKNSLFSIASTTNSSNDYQNSILPKNNNDSRQSTNIQQVPSTSESYFDLVILLKKNFKCDCLIPLDLTNDILLNFNVYLGLKNVGDDFMSAIYLNQDLLKEPAIIISSNLNDFSLIVAPIGGLRKYSYCILPNPIVEIFLNHLQKRNQEEIKLQLFEYFQTATALTKKTINFILANDYLPKSKVFFKRSRFKIEGNGDDDGDVVVAADQESGGLGVENPTSEQGFYLSFESDISTTDKPQYINTVAFPQTRDQMDPFPHNHMGVYSNDLNLSEFESSLTTKVDLKTGVVENKYSSTILRRLPKKLQTILNHNCVSLYKGFDFYQYQISCYYNIVPNGDFINNHYTNLLNLNLLKKFENVESSCQQTNEEDSIIRQKSTDIMKHKVSIQSLQQAHAEHDQHNSRGSSIFEEPHEQETLSISPDPLDDHHHMNKLVSSVLNFKNRLFRGTVEEKTPKISYENPFYHEEDELELDPYTKLISVYQNDNYNTSGYDSINEEPISYLHRNDYQMKYQMDYDSTLSYIYFAMTIISLFLSGIQLGIIYSIFNTSLSGGSNSQFLIRDNLGILIVLVLAMIVSLLFNLIAINLLFHRFDVAPSFHCSIVWGGFLFTCLGCLWSCALLVGNF
ncbi:uncharacterized protein LODBEIA_P31860 [Lodderomyces beijingensis]|uniref:SPX domain-containing protein n=1 Tax=Lodderomyces beijingensis TaxID=1775926 RepID=A0ABP0ZNN4_9ASCO